MREIFFRQPWIGLAACAALTLASATALAGDVGTRPDRHRALMEMQTAQFYAGDATNAKTDAAARTDLRKARACLLGGTVDYSVPNPCATQGNGAITDATNPVRQELAQNALSQIDNGLTTKKLTLAKASAEQAIQNLRMAVE